MQLALILASADDAGPSLIASLLPFILIGFIMYLLLIRPQRRRAKQQAELQRAVSVGDEVVTTSGVYGFITGEDGPNRFWLEVDENVQIRISRAAVQQKVDTTAEDDDIAEPADGNDDVASENDATSDADET